ncbi:unnamed protein product [Meloidogyne enterolobii]|uniref:Uncharacterized protein n=1 Tax=Meloidogyne enterolobii TaxID=390850 RepID=A0ACB0ZP38_MELEN
MDSIQERREILKILDVLDNRLIAMENMLHAMAESNARLHQRIDQLEEENRKLRKIIEDSGSSFWRKLWRGIAEAGVSLVKGLGRKLINFFEGRLRPKNFYDSRPD